MRGKVKVFTLASVALLSCRAVLGIEDIEDIEEGAADGGTGTGDAAADSTPVDTSIDTGVDAGVCSDKTGGDCTKCCRELGKENYKDLENLIKPCLCDGGCAGSCAANICMGGDTAQTACLPCMDTAIKASQCPKEKNDCFAKAACKPVYDCIAACK